MSRRLFGPNGRALPLVNEKHEQKRPALADMMSLPKKFRPVIIPGPSETNDKYRKFVPINDNDNPTKDEIIGVIGKAYPELVSFLKDTDELKRLYAEACGVIKEMYRAGTGKRTDPERGVVEDIEDTRLRGNRATDVLRTIAYNIKRGDITAQDIARRFFEEEDKRESLRG